MPDPRGFPSIAPYDTSALIRMLTSLAGQKSARSTAQQRALLSAFGQLGGAIAGQQRRGDVKEESKADRDFREAQAAEGKRQFDVRYGPEAQAAAGAAALQKEIDRVDEQIAAQHDREREKGDPPGSSAKMRYLQDRRAALQARATPPAPAAAPRPSLDASALDRPPADVAPSAPPGLPPSAPPNVSARTPATPAEIIGRAVAERGPAAGMFGPPPPQATPIRRPQPVRPSLRNRQFMSPLSTSAQSFQIDKVLKNDPKARQLGEDTDPDTELGRFYKDAAELVTAGGFSPEEALEKVVALLNDPGFVNENLSSLARHEGGVERGQLVATPYFLAREKGAPPYVVDKRTGEQFLLRGGGGLADAPRALKGVVESLMPGTTSLTADPPGSTVKELQERLGGKLVRRGSPIDALGAAGTIMGQGGLHLRVTGPGLAKYHAALAPETLLQWLRRAEASKHIR